MHASLLFPNEYLCAGDLNGADVTLTISRLEHEELRSNRGTEMKWCLYFAEVEKKFADKKAKYNKKLVLNKTNAQTIAKLHGSETDEWVGKRITVYPTTCKLGSETVECVRIRKKETKPGAKQNSEASADEVPA